MIEIILASFGIFLVAIQLILAIVTIKDFNNAIHNAWLDFLIILNINELYFLVIIILIIINNYHFINNYYFINNHQKQLLMKW